MTSTDDFFLTLKLSSDNKDPLYVQLYRLTADAIRNGQLAAGYRLPSIRRLAKQLSVNPGTVVNAYDELEKNGFIFSRPGSGSTVSENLFPDRTDFDNIPDLVNFSGNEYSTDRNNTINMRTIALNPDIISIDRFRHVSDTVLDRDKAHAFSTDDSCGFSSLRQSIAEKLSSTSFPVAAANIQIISGAQQGIDLVARAVISHGDYVFTESPTYPGAIAAFRAAGAKIIGIPLKQDGIDIDCFETSLKKYHPRLIYLMPNLQNPTSISCSNEKRARLIGLARYYNALVLEDDYLGDLIYQPVNFKPLKALDNDDRVIYLKSLSQLFMPGLHIGFLAAPAALTPRIAKLKKLTDLSTSGLNQRILDLYLRENIWDEHLRHIRSIYSQRFKFTCQLLKKYLPPKIVWQKPLGGLSLWLELPPAISAAKITAQVQNKGLLITDGNEFFPAQKPDRFLRISFALLSPPEITNGIKILAAALNKS